MVFILQNDVKNASFLSYQAKITENCARQETFLCKTKPIYSYCVLRKESQGLRGAYCEKEFEKTKPIYERLK